MGLRAIATVFGTAGLAVLVSYAHPALARYRPWEPGDPVPVVAALLPSSAPKVVEDDRGGLVSAEVAVDALAPPDPPSAAVDATTTATTLPARPPGVPTALVDEGYRGMGPFYTALSRVEDGTGLARASQWGDSTIAADGITGTVRSRLQARFGDGGPGYLSAGMDPRWSNRPDVTVGRHGEWSTVSLLNGGGSGRYGYGGIVSVAHGGAYVTFSPKSGKRLSRFEAWYQLSPGGGAWWASADGAGIGSGTASAERVGDGWKDVDVPQGFAKAAIGATNGSVPLYGVVLESSGPGVTWDALGVIGVGNKSFTQYNQKHLAAQVAHRRPDLIVIMLGGNELGFPVLQSGDAAAYTELARGTLRMLRAGAPTAGCLIVTPLDQGEREGETIRTKKGLKRAIASQRQVAAEEGCAFWDAWAAMGGEGAVSRWMRHRPALAWADLVHLSGAGQDIIGQLLADAIEAGYGDWKSTGGSKR